MKTTIVFIGDTHTNSKVGLSSALVELDEGGTYYYNKLQNWLLANFTKFVEHVSLHKAAGHRIILVLNGDIVDMNSKDPIGLINQNPAFAVRHALEVLQPLTRLAEKIFVVRGTPVHTGDTSYLEELIAEALGAETNQETTNRSHWVLNLKVGDVLFNVAHHGRTGQRAWTVLGPLMSFGSEMIIESVRQGVKPPDVIIRSHKHIHLDTGEALPVRDIQLPCWQFPTAFVVKHNIVRLPSFGGVLITVDGSIETVKAIHFEVGKNEYNSPIVV